MRRLHTDLSSRVGALNPAWNEASSPELENERFKEAVCMVLDEFVAAVRSFHDVWLPAREVVVASLKQASTVHASGAIMRLDRFCPWKSHFFELEKELPEASKVLYVLFEDTSGSWYVLPSVVLGCKTLLLSLAKPLYR